MKKLLLVPVLFLISITNSDAQCSGFYDGFESGLFTTPWTMGTGTYTMTVPSSGAAVGTYYLSMSSTGSNSFYQGPMATFTAAQPTYVSWWMKTDNGTSANGYFVLGDANTATNNGIIFCYFTSTNNLRFFGSTGYNHPVTLNAWHHVEAMNMNWTSRTMDIYVDGVLVLTGWPFRSTTTTAVDRVLMHSLNAANVGYDDILIGSSPVSATSVSSSVSCFGGSNGSATVTASGGNGIYTYNWSPSGGTAATATGLVAGTYVCTITDGLGCTATQSVTVTEPSQLSITDNSTSVSCFGGSDGSATLTVSGGTPSYSYVWTPAGGPGATVTGPAGTYMCNVTDANGCSSMYSVTITEPNALMTAATNNGNICPWDTATLIGTATGGTMSYNYTWLPGNLNGSVVSTTAGGTTTYSLVVTDANGCVDTATTTVAVYNAPSVSLGPDMTQCGGNITLDAGSGGTTYAWSEGSNTQSIIVSTSGSFDVVVTDANGCNGYDTIAVTINSLPVVVGSAAMNTVCLDDATINLFGSPTGGTWTGPGVFGNTFEPDTAGTGMHNLIYSYTDSLGCTGYDTIQIDVQLCLATNETTSGNLYVYPNPNNGDFTLVMNESSPEVNIEITDVQGRVVFVSRDENTPAGFAKQIVLGDISTGIYLMHVKTGDGVNVYRIDVQR